MCPPPRTALPVLHKPFNLKANPLTGAAWLTVVHSEVAPPEEPLNQLKWKELGEAASLGSWQRGVCVTNECMCELNCRAMEMRLDSTHFDTLDWNHRQSEKWLEKKGQPTNHSRTVCAISAEECQHFSGFWSLFGTGNTHTHILRKKEMVYYVKDCIFFSLYAFPTFPAFLTLINGHSVRGSREVKLITLIDFEANKPKTHTHTHKNTARDLSDIRLECKKYWLSKIPAYAHIVPWMAASNVWE